jgi:hypothetical protein
LIVVNETVQLVCTTNFQAEAIVPAHRRDLIYTARHFRFLQRRPYQILIHVLPLSVISSETSTHQAAQRLVHHRPCFSAVKRIARHRDIDKGLRVSSLLNRFFNHCDKKAYVNVCTRPT